MRRTHGPMLPARLPARGPSGGVRLACMLLAGALLLPVPAPAAAQDAAATARELAQAREALEAIAAARRKLETERGAATRALRDADETVAAAARELATLQRRIADHTAALARLQEEREALKQRLEAQRASLAALLRAAYVLGEDAPLKLLLAQDRVADGHRLLAYHGYLQRERARRIEQLATELQGLAALEQETVAERAALEAAQADRKARLAALEAAREARAGTLAQLENRYRDRAGREAELGRDVASLEKLLRTLREAAARAPAPAPGAPPAGGPRVGGLGWPVSGTLLAGFGGRMPDGRRSDGVLVAAEAGTEVAAAAAGRVVFADWMNGYGMILIVDHGGETMSLYAHNDTLLRDVGDSVERGDVVARVGSSGGQGRAALYFELRRNGKPVDPAAWLQRR